MDVLLGGSGDIALNTGFVFDVSLVRQRMQITMQANRGEWALDPNFGIPWSDWSTTKNLDLRLASALIRQQISDIEGIARVDLITATRSADGSTISFEGTAYAENGDALAISVTPGDTGFSGINGTHLSAVKIVPVGRR